MAASARYDVDDDALPELVRERVETLDRKRSIPDSKSNTLQNRERSLRAFGSWLAENDVHPLDFDHSAAESMILDLAAPDDDAAGYTPVFVRSIRWEVHRFYRTLAKTPEYADRLDATRPTGGELNPMDRVEWSKEHASLFRGTKKEKYIDERGGFFAPTKATVEDMAEHAPAPRFRNRLIIRLMFQTGVRASELRDMKVENIDREERAIDVYSCKLDSDEYDDADPWRTVYYAPSLDADLERWIDWGDRDAIYHAEDSPYLFPTTQREKITTKTINEAVRDAAENAGHQEVLYHDAAGNPRRMITSHSLRHAFARELMTPDDAGRSIDVKRLSRLMGHQDTQTTEQYLHFAGDDLAEAYALYGPQ